MPENNRAYLHVRVRQEVVGQNWLGTTTACYAKPIWPVVFPPWSAFVVYRHPARLEIGNSPKLSPNAVCDAKQMDGCALPRAMSRMDSFFHTISQRRRVKTAASTNSKPTVAISGGRYHTISQSSENCIPSVPTSYGSKQAAAIAGLQFASARQQPVRFVSCQSFLPNTLQSICLEANWGDWHLMAELCNTHALE